jgi:hypothetical protein
MVAGSAQNLLVGTYQSCQVLAWLDCTHVEQVWLPDSVLFEHAEVLVFAEGA